MTSRNGADVPAAIREFRAAGSTVAEIATDLGLHPSTIYRWQAGTRRPLPKNLAALAELVDARYSQHVHRRQLTVASLHLRQAAEALVTDQQRAKEEALARRMTADFAARKERREAEQARRNAAAARNRDEVLGQREPRRSAFADMDPFVVAGATTDTLPF